MEARQPWAAPGHGAGAGRLQEKSVPPVKRLVSIRLDKDVVEKFKAGGPGWQTRINAALRRARV
jgi:uncharacterized protein (DUF4415 family)